MFHAWNFIILSGSFSRCPIVNFSPKKDFPNNEDAERYIKDATIETLSSMNLEWTKEMIGKGIFPDINFFPSIKIMLYSIYYRLYDPSWKDSSSEATDVRIVSSVPYVDFYVTEKFQANIHDKIKGNVKRMKMIKTLRVKDLQ